MAKRALSKTDQDNIEIVDDLGRELVEFAKSLPKSREASLAVTKVEEAVMWLHKAITGPC